MYAKVPEAHVPCIFANVYFSHFSKINVTPPIVVWEGLKAVGQGRKTREKSMHGGKFDVKHQGAEEEQCAKGKRARAVQWKKGRWQTM